MGVNLVQMNIRWSKTSSLIGTTLFNIIVNLWVIETYSSATYLGLVSSLSGFSALIFSFLGGYLADSKYIMKILYLTDLISAFLCGIAYLAIQHISPFFIFPMIFLLNINVSLTNPLIKSLIANKIEKNNLIKFNSSLVIIGEIIKIVIPIISTFLYSNQFLSLKGALFINGVSFIFSFILIKKINVTDINQNIKKRSYITTIKYLKNKKIISLLLITGAMSNFILSGFNLVLPLYATEILNKSSYYGVFLSIESIGGLIGSLSTTIMPIDKDIVKERIGLLFTGLFLFVFCIFNSSIILMIICFTLNFFYVRYNIAFQSYIQSDVKSEHIGKTFSISYILSSLLLSTGSLFFGLLLSYSFIWTLIIISTGLTIINLIWVINHKKLN